MNPDSSQPPSRILLRAANWVGDAVMCLPALRHVRARFPSAHITILARPWVADLYSRERFADGLLIYPAARGLRDLPSRYRLAASLRRDPFDLAILFPNSFESAAFFWFARARMRIGYARDARSPLLTHPVPPPVRDAIPRHESFYYLELLRRAGLLDQLPDSVTIRLDGMHDARRQGETRLRELGLHSTVIGVSPGAAYGGAKRWPPDRFADAAHSLASQLGAAVAAFGAPSERAMCEEVTANLTTRGIAARNLAGSTSLRQFIELAAACRLFLTNDSGSMHIASAAGVPTVAIFGATDHFATGPTGPLARIVREPVDCSPCLLRDCPIDHRCMLRVAPQRVAQEALSLLK